VKKHGQKGNRIRFRESDEEYVQVPGDVCEDNREELMAELSQVEADRLINLDKKGADNKTYTFPAPGTHTVIPIMSIDDSV